MSATPPSSIALYLILLAGIGIVLGHVEAHAHRRRPRATPPLVSEVALSEPRVRGAARSGAVALAYYAAFRFRFQGAEFAHFLTLLRRLISAGPRLPARRDWRWPASIGRSGGASARAELAGHHQGHRDRVSRLGAADPLPLSLQRLLARSCSPSTPWCWCSCSSVSRVADHVRRRVPAAPSRRRPPDPDLRRRRRRRAAGAHAARGSDRSPSCRSASSTTTRRSAACGSKACRSLGTLRRSATPLSTSTRSPK